MAKLLPGLKSLRLRAIVIAGGLPSNHLSRIYVNKPFDAKSSAFLLTEPESCPGECASSDKLGFRFSYAYQPIVDIRSRTVYAHEALVRGEAGEPAGTILSQVTDANRYRFDQACRVKAIKPRLNLGFKGSCRSIFCLTRFISRKSASRRP